MTSIGAGAFAQGFAQAFTAQLQRRQEAKDRENQMTLQYRLQELSKQRDEWKTKRDQEQELINRAKFVAQKYNDPSLASVALDYFKNGYSVQQFSELMDSGQLQKKSQNQGMEVEIPNPEVSFNQRKVAVPAGVDMAQAPEEQFPEVPAASPLKKRVESDPLAEVDERVKKIAPSLLEERGELPKLPEEFMPKDSQWTYVPPTQKTKLGSLADEMAWMAQAEKMGDKIKAEQHRQNIEIIQRAKYEEARAKAKAEGMNFGSYAIVDKFGQLQTIVGGIPGENGLPVDPATGEEIKIDREKGEQIKALTEDQVKRIEKLQDDFRKDSKDLRVSKQSLAESVKHASNIRRILTTPGNEHISTMAVAGLANFEQLLRNVDGFSTIYGNLNSTKAEVEKAVTEGDLDRFSHLIGQFENQAREIDKMAQRFAGIIGPENARLIIDKLRYDNEVTLFAYKVALMNGSSGRDLSDKELELSRKLAGGDISNPQAILEVIKQPIQAGVNRVDAMSKELKNAYANSSKTLGGVNPIDDIGEIRLSLGTERLAEIFGGDQEAANFLGWALKGDIENKEYTKQQLQEQESRKSIQIKLPNGKEVITNKMMKTPSGKVGYFNNEGKFVVVQEGE